MSTSATGRLVDEDDHPWVDMTVVARDVSGIFDSEMARRPVGAESDGRFLLTYEAGESRTIEFEVTDMVGRRVALRKRDDVPATTLELGDVVILRSEASGYLVTLGTGVAERVSRRNAVDLLIDNERAWGRVSDLCERARLSIDLMQLNFEVPSDFERDPADEEPVMVLKFGANPFPRKVDENDARPERVLFTKGDRADVRILLNRFQADLHALGAALTVPGLGLLAYIVGFFLVESGKFTDVDEVDAYFDAARRSEDGDGDTLPRLKVFEARSSAFGPTHAKLAVIDGGDPPNASAVMISSPFRQAYFDDHVHAIEDPRRGLDPSHHPFHDVSMAVRGPAVADLHEAFRLHWNIATPAGPTGDPEPIPAIPRPPEPEVGGDAMAALQVVRTLATGRFADPADGEQGILEAYLRAIATARQFIYLENQFFTNDTIGDALIRALKDPSRPSLEVIMLLNIDPDSVLYARWQRRLIARIRAELTDLERVRFEVFTRWTHEAASPPEHPRPRIVDTYVHSKVGIADDQWATIGSANLDGTSLDATHYFHGATFGDVRASEINCLILNGVDGQPETTAVELLRRSLWAEHLGYESEPGVPDWSHQDLAEPPDGGWLALWDQRANRKRDLLRSDPTRVSPIDVLHWPNVDRTLSSPREHLEAALGMKLTNLDPIAGPRAFSFKKGAPEGPPAEVER